ncbi:MAG: hypothetical protein ACOX0X_03235 [Candidatus Dojkabacteria bacterium]
MNNFSFKDFFSNHKKSIILSCIILVLLILLVFLLRTESVKDFVKDLGIGKPKIENYAETVENDNPNCTLTKIEYPESAFSIGVPNGWFYALDNGTVSIMEDGTNTTAVLIYTAKLQQELTKQDILNTFSTILQQTTEEGEGTFQMQDIVELEESEDEAYADVTATINGYNIKGKMLVSKSKDFVTFKVYWAPTEVFEERESLLKEISGCFARTRVLTDDILLAEQTQEPDEKQVPEGFKTHKGKYFQLDKPSDYAVENEQKDFIQIIKSDQRTVLSYMHTTELKGEYTPRTWAEEMFSQIKEITNITLTDGPVLPSQILGYSAQEFDLSGKMQGIPILGKVTVGVYQPPYSAGETKYASAYGFGQMTIAENWENVKGDLQKIQDSFDFVDMNMMMRKNTLLPIINPIENTRATMTAQSSTYSQSLANAVGDNWLEGMRGYQMVTSPSTGQTYNVPVNSWSVYGPEGSGYYRILPDNTFEKLQLPEVVQAE